MRLQPGADLSQDEVTLLLTMASIEDTYKHLCSVCDTLAHSDVPGEYRETRVEVLLATMKGRLAYSDYVRTSGDEARIYGSLSAALADLSQATQQLATLQVLGNESGGADVIVHVGEGLYDLDMDAASDDTALDASSRVELLLLLASRYCDSQAFRAFAAANPDNIPF